MRKILVFLAAATILLVTGPGSIADPKQPALYKGKTFRQWVEALKNIWHPDDQQEARRVLGPRGPYARMALPALIEALRDRKGLDFPVEETVIDYGPKAVPLLIQSLSRRDPALKWGIVTALGHFKPRARQAVPALVEALKDSDLFVREAAAQALGQMGPDAGRACHALLLALGDDSGFVNMRAAKALRKIGPNSKQFGQELVAALLDSNRSLREAAADLLADASLDPPSSVPGLIKALKGDNSYVRVRVAAALGRFGSPAAPAVPALREALRDKDEKVRESAASAFDQLSAIAKPAVPDLIAAAGDEKERVRESALSALNRIAPKETDLPITIQLLRRAAGKNPWHDFRDLTDDPRLGVGKDSIPAIRALAAIAADQTEWPGLRQAASKAALKIVDPEARTNLWLIRLFAAMDAGSSLVSPLALYMQRDWIDLASNNPSKAYQAEWKFILIGDPAAFFLRNFLRPIPEVSAERIADLARKLDANDFKVRQAANGELELIVEQAEQELRQTLARTQSAEVRRRAGALLENCEQKNFERNLRGLRAVAVLERIGGGPSMEVLRSIAGGAPAVALTREARAALRRLGQRNTKRDHNQRAGG
jgi:HEAT repeat protein